MKRFGIFVLSFICFGPSVVNGPIFNLPSVAPVIPKVIVTLPQEMDSAKVAIIYFMTGLFGSYGNTMQQLPNQSAYSFEAGINGARAANIKFVVYAPGCSFAIFDIPVRGDADIKVLYACNPLGSVTFTGKISPGKAFHGKDVYVDVVYHSNLSDSFFQTSDGLVTLVPVATAVPDNNGVFQVQLPDLLNDAITKTFPLQNSTFRFVLREKKSMNVISMLSINLPKNKSEELPLAASYPNPVPLLATDLD